MDADFAAYLDAKLIQLEALLAGYGPRWPHHSIGDPPRRAGDLRRLVARPALERIAEFLHIPIADVYGVTEFYEMFHTEPAGRKVIRICQDGPCAVAGADRLLADVCGRLGVAPGGTTADGAYTVEPVRCLGLCDRAPAALVNLERHAPAAPEALFDGRPGACQAADRRHGQGGAIQRRRGGPDKPGRLSSAGRHGRAAQGADAR